MPGCNVEFDLWNGESDVQEYIPGMVEGADGHADWPIEDQGAIVVDVKEETDTKEVPPCMILKSDGAALYTTTDLATILERMEAVSSGRDPVRGGQAAGDAFCAGVPLCQKGWHGGGRTQSCLSWASEP